MGNFSLRSPQHGKFYGNRKYYSSEMLKKKKDLSGLWIRSSTCFHHFDDIFQLYASFSYCKQHHVAYKCILDGLDKTNKQWQGKDVVPANRLMKVLGKLQCSIRESVWHCLPENIRFPVHDFFLVEDAGLDKNHIFYRNNTRSQFGEKKICSEYFPNIMWCHYQMVSNWPFRADESPVLP